LKRFAALALLAALVGSSLAGCIFVPPHDHDHSHHDHDHDGRY
jgi:predicted small lipoprotein YifL